MKHLQVNLVIVEDSPVRRTSHEFIGQWQKFFQDRFKKDISITVALETWSYEDFFNRQPSGSWMELIDVSLLGSAESSTIRNYNKASNFYTINVVESGERLDKLVDFKYSVTANQSIAVDKRFEEFLGEVISEELESAASEIEDSLEITLEFPSDYSEKDVKEQTALLVKNIDTVYRLMGGSGLKVDKLVASEQRVEEPEPLI